MPWKLQEISLAKANGSIREFNVYVAIENQQDFFAGVVGATRSGGLCFELGDDGGRPRTRARPAQRHKGIAAVALWGFPIFAVAVSDEMKRVFFDFFPEQGGDGGSKDA